MSLAVSSVATLSHKALFQALDNLLLASRPLWQVQAFEARELPWQAQFPTLAEHLWQTDDDLLDRLDSDSVALHRYFRPALEADLTALGQDWSLDLLSEMSHGLSHGERDEQRADTGLSDLDLAHLSAHIKGRKWQQITAFVGALSSSELETLEWCAGKGHLGRLLAKVHGRQVTSLEWQQSLCDAGQVFADKWRLPQSFVCGDALSAEVGSLLKQDQQAVALHACGELHLALLRGACAAKTKSLAIAPCCYHLIPHRHYHPLSLMAKASQLRLSRHDLQLSLQRSVIANDKARAQRLQEVSWRLGFDSLQRDVTHSGRYLPIPSIKQSQLSGSFEAFCDWAAKRKGVELPGDWSSASYLQRGIERQRLTRRIDLVAHLFRETLERWLLLDRVCFLEEAGYRVDLSAFCALTITPRNSLIVATKP